MDHQDDLAQKQAALLQHQANIQAAASVLQSLQNTLSQQENALAALLAEKPDLESLNRKYEDALAEAVADDADKTTLDSLAGEIEAAKLKLLKFEPEIERCRKTIAGLQRKVASQEEALSVLRVALPGLIRNFLLAESNAVAVRYLEMADALLREHHRLEGLSALLVSLGHVPGISPNGGGLVLPAYELPAFDGRRFLHDRKCVFKGPIEWTPRRGFPCAVREAEQVRSMGIDFDGYQEQAK
ncbi:MAG: hypothetical protein KGZ68_00880 [Dechloromonas sp.]|jgi:glutamine synthetase adenylyltransferase|nr:hypothetical protein [Dechloromonas sp.]